MRIRQKSPQAGLLRLGGLFFGTTILGVLVIIRLMAGKTFPISLIVSLLFLFGTVVFNRRLREAISQDMEYLLNYFTGDKNEKLLNSTGEVIGISLHCSHCGLAWQKTIEEWEAEEQILMGAPHTPFFTADDDERFKEFNRELSVQKKTKVMFIISLFIVTLCALGVFGIQLFIAGSR